MNKDFFRLAASLGGLAVMLCAETRWPARVWETARLRRFLFHINLTIFNALILRFPAVMPLFFWENFINAKLWGILPLLGLNGTLEVIATVIILDFFDYLWHRGNHRIPFLWRFHKVHHVDTHLDVTTSLRFHAGELFFSAGIKALWFFILGPSLWAFAVFESAVTLAAQFHHSNIDFPDNIENLARKFVVTPRFHASHHTVSRRTSDANFSTIFIFWDKLCGTYREPDYGEMQTLGLDGGRQDYLSFIPTLKGPFTSQY